MTSEKKKNTLIVFTEKQVTQIEALATYLNCEQIADYFGINPDTFHNIKNRQQEVLRAYKKGKAQAIEVVAKSLMQKVIDGDTTATIFFLKTQAGWSSMENRGNLKSKIKFSKDKNPLEIIDGVLEGIEKGEITTQEATQIASLANLKANIIAGTSLKNEPIIQSWETKEKILRELEKIIEEREKVEI